MNSIHKAMINNTVKLAQYKLAQHRVQGTKSKLNIFEVAQLMDSVRMSGQIKEQAAKSIFHSKHLK